MIFLLFPRRPGTCGNGMDVAAQPGVPIVMSRGILASTPAECNVSETRTGRRHLHLIVRLAL
jgi:hypothetical protein